MTVSSYYCQDLYLWWQMIAISVYLKYVIGFWLLYEDICQSCTNSMNWLLLKWFIMTLHSHVHNSFFPRCSRIVSWLCVFMTFSLFLHVWFQCSYERRLDICLTLSSFISVCLCYHHSVWRSFMCLTSLFHGGNKSFPLFSTLSRL